MEQFPRNLKGDEGLARTGGEREQDTLSFFRDGLHHPLDGDVLVVAAGVGSVHFAVRFYVRGFEHFVVFYRQRAEPDPPVGLFEPLTAMKWKELLMSSSSNARDTVVSVCCSHLRGVMQEGAWAGWLVRMCGLVPDRHEECREVQGAIESVAVRQWAEWSCGKPGSTVW